MGVAAAITPVIQVKTRAQGGERTCPRSQSVRNPQGLEPGSPELELVTAYSLLPGLQEEAQPGLAEPEPTQVPTASASKNSPVKGCQNSAQTGPKVALTFSFPF